MMSKKILLINNGYPSSVAPNYAGYIKTINECLTMAGFKVDLLILKLEKSGTTAKYFQYIKFFIELLIHPLSYYDIIYINHASFAIPVFFRPSLYKKKIIIHWHGNELHWHGNELIIKTKYIKFCLFLLRPIVQNMLHVGPSLYFKEKIIEIFGIHENNIIISPSGGVDESLFVPSGKKKEKEEFSIGFASALDKSKGVDLLLGVIKRWHEIQEIIESPIKFHVINYGIEKNKFKEKCHNEKYPVCVHEKMEKEKMIKYYNLLDVLLMPSRGESLGLVALEAMSCNVPVITYSICAFPEFVIPGKTGMLITLSDDNNENVESFVKAIISLFHRINEFNPREIVLQKYSSTEVINQYKNLL
jgi:glycosyltransferase involved in cell wall biosynthesis